MCCLATQRDEFRGWDGKRGSILSQDNSHNITQQLRFDEAQIKVAVPHTKVSRLQEDTQ